MKLAFSVRYGLILGGNCELGISLSMRLMKAGMFPVLTCRNQVRAEAVSSALSDFNGKFETALLDFSDRRSLEGFFHQLNDDPDFLVDLVHGNLERLVGSASDDEIFQYFSENVAFRGALLKRVTRAMLKRRRGRLVYVSSIAAARPKPGQGFYAAAKLASEAMYRNIGLEMGKRGITTVSLRPGYIDVGRAKTWLAANPNIIRELVPLGRSLTVGEVVDTILYFLSDSAKGINAVEVSMDGGLSVGK